MTDERCPVCGADLVIPAGEWLVKCPYCRVTFRYPWKP